MDDKVPVLGSVMVQQGLVGWLNKGAVCVGMGDKLCPSWYLDDPKGNLRRTCHSREHGQLHASQTGSW